MPGGLFAIDRHFWEKIGKYDLGMDIWGVSKHNNQKLSKDY